MIKLAIGIPTAGLVPVAFATSLARLMAMLVREGLPSRPGEKVDAYLQTAESSNWIDNRSRLVKLALDTEATHLLFLDDDHVFNPKAVDILFSRKKDIVLSNYLVKQEPATLFTTWGLDDKNIVTRPESTGVEKVAGGGFGLSLISTRVFRTVPAPWFTPRFDEEKKIYTTEDLPFFSAAREAGYDVWVDHDASKMIGHLGRKMWHMNEWIDPAELEQQ